MCTAGQRSEPLQGSARVELWRCHICTYDNEQGMNFCDICGCLRYPLVEASNKNEVDSGMSMFFYFSSVIFCFDVLYTTFLEEICNLS